MKSGFWRGAGEEGGEDEEKMNKNKKKKKKKNNNNNKKTAFVSKHRETAAWLRAQLSISRRMTETVKDLSSSVALARKNESFQCMRA